MNDEKIQKIKSKYKALESTKNELLKRKESNLNNLNIYLNELRSKIKRYGTNNDKVSSLLEHLVIENDEILSLLEYRKHSHRMLKIRCLDCGSVREVALTNFLSDRPLKCGMCVCKLYQPKVDNTYIDTLRNNVIYIGKDSSFKSKQEIWVKCIECNQHIKVNANEYLLGKIYCNHNVQYERNKKESIFQNDIFIESKGVIKYHSDDIGKKYNSDKVLGLVKEKNRRYIHVECIICNQDRLIPELEFYSKIHTKSYTKCNCQVTFDDIKLAENYYVGCKFNHLTILNCYMNKNKRMVQVKCDCIKQTIFETSYFGVIHSLVKSCGCAYAEERAIHFNHDYIGKRYNDLEVVSIYKRLTFNSKIHGTLWKCKCLLCNSYVDVEATLVVRNIMKNCGCKHLKYLTDYTIGQIIFGGFKIIDIFSTKNGTYYSCQCPYCNDLKVGLASTFIKSQHFKSCGCLVDSYGERLVKNYLDEHKFIYNREKTFDDLGFNGRYDFCVLLNNNFYLIEYDGAQHYYSSFSNFDDLKRRDSLKNEYAIKNNYPLLRIKYNLNKEEVINQLKEFLGG